jgi:hypothetical protein
MIEIVKVENTANEHYQACFPYVKVRLIYVCDVFNALGNNIHMKFTPSSPIEKHYNNLPYSTLKFLINPILNEKYKKVSHIYKIDNVQLLSILTSGNSSFTNHSVLYYQEGYHFFKSILENLDLILIGKPIELYNNFVNEKQKYIQSSYKQILESIFSYETLTGDGFKTTSNVKWNSYQLTKKLGQNVCVYCNKNWINTVFTEDDKKITNPQLDHYFNKSTYPLLRLSFYNLVPSCETCNSRIKKRKDLDFSKNVHPFGSGFEPYGKIIAKPTDTKSSHGIDNNFEIILNFENNPSENVKQKIQNSFDFFKIKNVYEVHGDIFKEIHFKHQKYGFTRLYDLLSDPKFKGMKIEDLYNFIYGNYYDSNDFSKRPFSKVTKDTLENLQLI